MIGRSFLPLTEPEGLSYVPPQCEVDEDGNLWSETNVEHVETVATYYQRPVVSYSRNGVSGWACVRVLPDGRPLILWAPAVAS